MIHMTNSANINMGLSAKENNNRMEAICHLIIASSIPYDHQHNTENDTNTFTLIII